MDRARLGAIGAPLPTVLRVATRLVDWRIGLAGREVVGALPCAIFCSTLNSRRPVALHRQRCRGSGGAHGELEVGAVAVGEQLRRLVKLDDVARVEHEDAREVGAGAGERTTADLTQRKTSPNDIARKRVRGAFSTHMVLRRWATTSSVDAPN